MASTAPGGVMPHQIAHEIAVRHLQGNSQLRKVQRASMSLLRPMSVAGKPARNPTYIDEQLSAPDPLESEQVVVEQEQEQAQEDEDDVLAMLTKQLRDESLGKVPTAEDIRDSEHYANYRPTAQQYERVINKTGGQLCKYGWKCWLHNGCGGVMDPGMGKYQHREPLLANDPIQLAQYAVCMSFIRRAKTSDVSYVASNFLRPFDQFVMSGLKYNPCLSKEGQKLTVDPTDAEAIYFVAERQGPEHDGSALVIPKGIFLAAALFHGAIAWCELDELDGPDMPIYLAPPCNQQHTVFTLWSKRQQQQQQQPPPPSLVVTPALPPTKTVVAAAVAVTGSSSRSSNAGTASALPPPQQQGRARKGSDAPLPAPLKISEPMFVVRRATGSGSSIPRVVNHTGAN